ncbi:MAG: CoA-binding protein [Dehalococcoidia bacterium]|nr:MAG: CoA-binding protein [Dehalococcoidia bacterium]
MQQAVDDFLSRKRIAVVGVSRDSAQAANLVYRNLRKANYEVFAVNPNSTEVEGDACYADLKSVPGGVEAAMIVTTPLVADDVVQECAELGIDRVWMHRSFGKGSVSPSAEAFCRERGIAVIAGGCPNMFLPGTDFGHKCMKWMLKVTGGAKSS